MKFILSNQQYPLYNEKDNDFNINFYFLFPLINVNTILFRRK